MRSLCGKADAVLAVGRAEVVLEAVDTRALEVAARLCAVLITARGNLHLRRDAQTARAMASNDSGEHLFYASRCQHARPEVESVSRHSLKT